MTALASILAFISLIALNLAYGARAVLRDKSEGQILQAVIGAVCLLGMNLLVGWFIYSDLMRSTDL